MMTLETGRFGPHMFFLISVGCTPKTTAVVSTNVNYDMNKE